MNLQSAIEYLTETSQTLLAGCRVAAQDGTILYTPDGHGNYPALWTRDFAYMVENAAGLIPPEEIQAGIRFLLRGQRADGAMPDRVRPDGLAVYVAGPEDQPMGEPNLDNPAFLVIAADTYLRGLPPARAAALYQEWAPALARGLDYVPRSPAGLVSNDPLHPHSPYGFTDTVRKTGELFFESLLDWTAAQRMAFWEEQTAGQPAPQRARAARIEAGLARLWDEQAGAFLAASQDCRQVDVWGCAYALYLGIPLGSRRERLLDFMEHELARYAWQGQIRHLLRGEYWQRTFIPVPPDEYQNGAYWATASGWVIWALAQRQPDLAQQVLDDLIASFRAEGVYECIHTGYHKLDSYVASATNPLGALRLLAQLPRLADQPRPNPAGAA